MSTQIAGDAVVLIRARDAGVAQDAQEIARKASLELQRELERGAINAEKARQKLLMLPPAEQWRQHAADWRRQAAAGLQEQVHADDARIRSAGAAAGPGTFAAQVAQEEQWRLEARRRRIEQSRALDAQSHADNQLRITREQQANARLRAMFQQQAATERMAVAARVDAMSRRNMLMTNVGFAIEDAASTYPTMGPAGALRAVSNNVSMMAMALGGWKLMLGAIAVTTAATVAPALYKMFDGSAERAKALQDELTRIDELLKSIGSRTSRDQSALGSLLGLERTGTAAAAFGQGQSAADSMRSLGIAIEDQEEAIALLNQELIQKAGQGGGRWAGDDAAALQPLRDRRAELTRGLEELRRQYAAAEQTRTMARSRTDRLGALETSQADASAALALGSDLDAARRLKSYEEAASRVRELREELASLRLEQQQLSDTRDATGIRTPETSLALQRNAHARLAAAQQMEVLEARLPALFRRQALERARGVFGGLSLGDDPALQRLSAQQDWEHRLAEIRRIGATNLMTPLMDLNDLSRQRSLLQIAMQEQSLNRTLGPQMGLEYGSVAAVQSAAQSADAAKTTEMAATLQSIDSRIAEIAAEFAGAAQQLEAP